VTFPSSLFSLKGPFVAASGLFMFDACARRPGLSSLYRHVRLGTSFPPPAALYAPLTPSMILVRPSCVPCMDFRLHRSGCFAWSSICSGSVIVEMLLHSRTSSLMKFLSFCAWVVGLTLAPWVQSFLHGVPPVLPTMPSRPFFEATSPPSSWPSSVVDFPASTFSSALWTMICVHVRAYPAPSFPCLRACALLGHDWCSEGRLSSTLTPASSVGGVRCADPPFSFLPRTLV